MDLNPFTAKAVIESLQGLVSLFRDFKDALPDGEEKDAVVRALEEADRQARLAELRIAETFDYAICKCEFPPVVCELHVVDDHGREQFKCSRCGRLYPPKLEPTR